MKQYLDLAQRILDEGVRKEDRTGTGTLSVFGHQMRFDLSQGFPLLTTKKMFWKGVVIELLWFLKGDTNVKYLNDNGVKFWNAWADDNGSIGPGYGFQFRAWPDYHGNNIDQVQNVIDSIKENPDSRRHIISDWNVAAIDFMQLPCCHGLVIQFYVANGKLSCQMYQRSGDVMLGIPVNIASYALLTMMIAQVTGLEPGEFIHTIGDAHIYLNHIEQIKLQLTREPRHLPALEINSEITDIDDFKYEDFALHSYDPHPHIKGEISV